jgi:hypothetical protein
MLDADIQQPTKIEITSRMVQAGADALFDGTEIEQYLSPTIALVVARNVLVAACQRACDESVSTPP